MFKALRPCCRSGVCGACANGGSHGSPLCAHTSPLAIWQATEDSSSVPVQQKITDVQQKTKKHRTAVVLCQANTREDQRRFDQQRRFTQHSTIRTSVIIQDPRLQPPPTDPTGLITMRYPSICSARDFLIDAVPFCFMALRATLQTVILSLWSLSSIAHLKAAYYTGTL